MQNINKHNIKKSTGSTMVEVLVSIVILAIGLLGYAGLLTRSIKNNQSSYFRSQATILTYDIVDCMRANITEAKSGSYNTEIGSITTGTSLAEKDINYWKSNIYQELPDGDGAVLVDVNGNITITILWNDGGTGNSESSTQFTTQTSL